MPSNIKTASFLLKLFLIINSAIILVPDKFKGIPVIGLLLSSIFYFIVFKTNKKPNFRMFFVSTSFVLALIISIAYSENISYAFSKLETGLSLLAYPFIFALIYNCSEQLSKKFIETLKLVFVATLVFFLVSSFIYYFLTEPFYTLRSTIVHFHTLVDLRIIGYEIHSIYLSMHIGVAIIFLTNFLIKEQGIKRVYYFIILILLFVFIAILNKKGPILALGILGIIFLIKSKVKRKAIVYTATLASVMLLVILFIPKFNNINKFEELIDIEGLKTNPESSTAIRLSIYDCAVKQGVKSPIIGYGWGDVKDVLNLCYKEHKSHALVKNHNTHNQFLSVFLATGIIGLSVFLFYFYFIFKFSNKNRNLLLYFLLLYFGLNMLSENILEREDGVIFFSFFINLFLFNSEKKPTETLKA